MSIPELQAKRSDLTQVLPNVGDTKLAAWAMCDKCHEPLAGVAAYARRTWRTHVMPASAFNYAHIQCA